MNNLNENGDLITAISDMTQDELEKLVALNTENVEIDLSSEIDDKDVELASELAIKREEYVSFYEDDVKDVILDFTMSNDLEGTLLYEARIKKDLSVQKSLERKNITLDELKDYLGVRFITETKEEAYTVAGLFMMNHCIPKDREEIIDGDEKRFHAYQTRDYFKRPKLDERGNVQYSGIHIFLEKEGRKFEMQIHDLESYEKAIATHEEYKMRKSVERETEELDLEDAIQFLE